LLFTPAQGLGRVRPLWVKAQNIPGQFY
jgi:hypothetical protein